MKNKKEKIEMPKIIVYNRKRHTGEMAVIENIDGLMVSYTVKNQNRKPITKSEMVEYIRKGVTVILMREIKATNRTTNATI